MIQNRKETEIMGTWSRKLYGNDVTSDVRDTYIDLLSEQESNEYAENETLNRYAEYLGTDEECLIWYALADTQWKAGRLSNNVKDNALKYIETYEGGEFWDAVKNGTYAWKSTLEELKKQIESPMPKEKKYRKVKPDIYNPWNVGDVYAYRFSTEYAKEKGLYGKYILMQKIGNVEGCNQLIFSRIYIFDKLFDEIPMISAIKGVRILPIDTPLRTLDTQHDIPLNMNAIMDFYKKNEYPEKRLAYLGNAEVEIETPCYTNRAYYGWYRLEENWLCSFYLQWRTKAYRREKDYYIVEL